MKKRGSLLIMIIIILAALEIMTLLFITIVRNFKKNADYTRKAEIALYNAEEGLNNVINVLMRDPDWDFRTAGSKCPKYGFPNTVPYSFIFENMNFKVQILSSTVNPITENTGISDPNFDTNQLTMWVKVTGFHYPHNDPNRYKNMLLNGQSVANEQVVARTILAKVAAAVPINPFKDTIFSCGTIDGQGSAEVEGDICAPTITGTIVDGDSDCSMTAEECTDVLDAVEAWANDICDGAAEEGNLFTDSMVALNNSFTGLNASGELEGNFCFENDVQWAGNAPGVVPVDVDGDMDYSDEDLGEIPPPIIIVKGNLKMTGTPDFQGIVIVMGDYEVTNDNLLSGDEDFFGSIISFDSLSLKGNSFAGYKDFSNFVNVNRNRVSRNAWVFADKPIRMEYPEGSGTFYNILISHLTPPDPAEWE